MSIWDWNVETELGKSVLMTSGQPPGKARSNLLCLTLLWSRRWARDIRGVFQPQPFCDCPVWYHKMNLTEMEEGRLWRFHCSSDYSMKSKSYELYCRFESETYFFITVLFWIIQKILLSSSCPLLHPSGKKCCHVPSDEAAVCYPASWMEVVLSQFFSL